MLKRFDSDINREDPWCDDELGISKVAESLTEFVIHQKTSVTLSLDGHWGTGKTFFLKRWKQELENSGTEVIYYNAWEDDFCSDPLTAILGQLWESFSRGKFKDKAELVKKNAGPLLTNWAIGYVNKRFSLNLTDLFRPDVLGKYAEQRKQKNQLKVHLERLSSDVLKKTGRPLVFIIDELDRCRPTFGLELLERVKHVFDTSNMVFVFGINRDEIGKSVQSVYGQIDADVYLRRFFDFEFTLPEVNSVAYCRFLVSCYNLEKFFDDHSLDPKWFKEFFPILCGCFGFSLRDIEHCIRTIAVVKSNITDNMPLRAVLLSLLVTLRLKKGQLYREYIRGERNGCEVMNYVDEQIRNTNLNDEQDHNLNELEAYLYLTDPKSHSADVRSGLSISVVDLGRLFEAIKSDGQIPQTLFVSSRTRNSDSSRIQSILGLVNRYEDPNLAPSTISEIASLIELYEQSIRS